MARASRGRRHRLRTACRPCRAAGPPTRIAQIGRASARYDRWPACRGNSWRWRPSRLLVRRRSSVGRNGPVPIGRAGLTTLISSASSRNGRRRFRAEFHLLVRTCLRCSRHHRRPDPRRSRKTSLKDRRRRPPPSLVSRREMRQASAESDAQAVAPTSSNSRRATVRRVRPCRELTDPSIEILLNDLAECRALVVSAETQRRRVQSRSVSKMSVRGRRPFARHTAAHTHRAAPTGRALAAIMRRQRLASRGELPAIASWHSLLLVLRRRRRRRRPGTSRCGLALAAFLTTLIFIVISSMQRWPRHGPAR